MSYDRLDKPGITELVTKIKAKVLGMGFLNHHNNYYGTCDTAADVAAKEIVISSDQGFVLETGATIHVLFTNSNSAQNPTFSVNGSAAKSVFAGTTVITTGSLTYAGYAGRIEEYTYNGTYWAWQGHSVDNNTTYSNRAAASGGTSTSLCTTGEKYTWNTKLSDNPTFTQASTRANIASGESLSTILGKIMKFFADLKTVAFTGSYNDLTDQPTIPAAQVQTDWNATSGLAAIANKPSSFTPASHTHGNITNDGKLQTTDVAIANGDKLVVTDSSNSAKIARTSVAFDGSTTTQALTKKGTFETFSKFSGSYNDLSDKPTIPAAQVNSDWNASSGVAEILNKPTIPAAQVNSDWNASSGVAEILNKPSSFTPASHTHGNVTNDGKLQTTDVAIANGDKLVVTDSSNSNKVARTSLAFDGSTTTQALTKKGTFEAFMKDNPAFTEASTRANIATGESFATILGKIKKFFTDLKNVAFTGKYEDLTNRAAANFYGTCDTAADEPKKTVTLSDTSGWELKAGVTVGVKFTNTNTASSCTLNINGTGDKSVYYNNAVNTGSSASIFGSANRTIWYQYDGTNWVWLNMGTLDGNTDTKVTQTVTTTNATYEVLFSVSTGNSTKTEGARKNNNLTFNPSTGNLTVTQLNGVTVGNSPKFTDTTYEFDNVPTNGSDNPVKSDGVYDADNDIYTVAGEMGAKNLIPFPYYRPSGYTHNGYTYDVDDDGVITVNGTGVTATSYFALYSDTTNLILKPSTQYILSFELENATKASVYISANNVDMVAIRQKSSGLYESTFTTPASLPNIIIGLYFLKGGTETNCKVKVMLRNVKDTDNTYRPYAMSNRKLTDSVLELNTIKSQVLDELDAITDVYGGKNLLPNNATSGSASGVTWTINTDGSITLSGTCNALTGFNIGTLYLQSDCILTGCPPQQSSLDIKYYLEITDGVSFYQADTGNGLNISYSPSMANTEYTVRFMIDQGASFSTPVTFYPMIRDARIASSSYTPHALTNRALTKLLCPTQSVVPIIWNTEFSHGFGDQPEDAVALTWWPPLARGGTITDFCVHGVSWYNLITPITLNYDTSKNVLWFWINGEMFNAIGSQSSVTHYNPIYITVNWLYTNQ